MTALLLVAVGVLVIVAVSARLWGAACVSESAVQSDPDPLVEALELRMQLHEMAHETRVEMIRAAREGSQ
jgi:hypothetical protein